jgi:intracellular septation protein A
MSDLVNQPSWAPTRKWWAGALAMVVANVGFGVLDAAWPDHPFTPYKADIIGWLVGVFMLIAAWFARNRA